jgi:hypothetical protein
LPPIALQNCTKRYNSIPNQLKRREILSPNNIRWILTITRHVINLIQQQQEFWIGMRFIIPIIIMPTPKINALGQIRAEVLKYWYTKIK